MADVDDHRIGPITAGQEMCDQLDGLLRGGKADANRRLVGERFKAFE